MTEKQKKAFLKAEGWIAVQPDLWTHESIDWFKSFDEAYRIASRRRRQREYRKLWGAGWLASRKYPGLWNNGKGLYLTRQEALQTLEKQP